MKRHLLAIVIAAAGAGNALAQSSDTLSKVRTSGKIVLGVRESSAPLSYTLGDGKYAGYHVELCEHFIRAIIPAVKIEYTPVTSANRIALVQNGTVDIECGSTTNNAARQKDVAFAVTTFVTEVRTAVKANSDIKSISQLNSKSIATTTGTTSVALLRKHERANSVDFKELYGKDHAESFLLLESGRADAFVMDDNILAGLIAASKSPREYTIVGETLNVEPIALMIRKDDASLKKALDDYIKAQMQSGGIDKLYAKWFLSPIPPKATSVNLAMGDTLKGLIKSPADKPAEDYNKK